jgi:TonB family protein
MHCDARPQYPLEAARKGVQGSTVIEVTFAPGGTVAATRVAVASGTRPENALLDQAALEAMAQCRLERADIAEASSRRIEYRWKLDEGTGQPLGDEAWRARQRQLAADDAALEEEARRGVAAAQLALAKQYADGERRDRNDKLAMQWFQRASEAGNADAQVYYGQRLMVGKGAPQDDAAGIAWLRKAAAQGSGSAAYGLGLFARAGRSLPKSEVDAFRWFLQGAQAGTRAAMVEVADAYAKGAGAPRDDTQAAHWYLAASAYNMYTVYRLGIIYRDGLGVPADLERAAFCMALAGRHGERAPGAALATIAPRLDAQTLARIQARADAWQVGDPLFP